MAGTSWPINRAPRRRAARPRRARRQLRRRRRLRARSHGGGRGLPGAAHERRGPARHGSLRLALVGVRLRGGGRRAGRHEQHHAAEEEPARPRARQGSGGSGHRLAPRDDGLPADGAVDRPGLRVRRRHPHADGRRLPRLAPAPDGGDRDARGAPRGHGRQGRGILEHDEPSGGRAGTAVRPLVPRRPSDRRPLRPRRDRRRPDAGERRTRRSSPGRRARPGDPR